MEDNTRPTTMSATNNTAPPNTTNEPTIVNDGVATVPTKKQRVKTTAALDNKEQEKAVALLAAAKACEELLNRSPSPDDIVVEPIVAAGDVQVVHRVCSRAVNGDTRILN